MLNFSYSRTLLGLTLELKVRRLGLGLGLSGLDCITVYDAATTQESELRNTGVNKTAATKRRYITRAKDKFAEANCADSIDPIGKAIYAQPISSVVLDLFFITPKHHTKVTNTEICTSGLHQSLKKYYSVLTVKPKSWQSTSPHTNNCYSETL